MQPIINLRHGAYVTLSRRNDETIIRPMLSMSTITQPEPGLTADEMIDRARRMRPVLLERQAQCEALGRLPEETNNAFVRAGFYRILQPRTFGGYEFDVPTFVDVMVEVSRGCPSSGWVLALTSGHPHTLSYLGEQAQREAYGDDGEFRAPFVATPSVFARPVDGGYVLSGGWDYASGCDIATHVLGHVLAPTGREGELPAIKFALLTRDQITIVDNWDVVGMRGTGSRRVEVRDVFVPAHRVAPSVAFGLDEALPSIHPNPMYRGKPLSLLMMEIACVSVGIARASLDSYEAILRGKRVRGPISPYRFEAPMHQRNFADASALIETAQAALRQIAREYMSLTEWQASGAAPFSDEDDHRLLLIEQQIARGCFEAVTLMFQTGGSSAGKSGAPLERYMRDMSFVMTHMGLEPGPWRESYARLHFGLPMTP